MVAMTVLGWKTQIYLTQAPVCHSTVALAEADKISRIFPPVSSQNHWMKLHATFVVVTAPWSKTTICVSPKNASPIMDANKGKIETQPKSLVDRRTVEVEPGK